MIKGELKVTGDLVGDYILVRHVDITENWVKLDGERFPYHLAHPSTYPIMVDHGSEDEYGVVYLPVVVEPATFLGDHKSIKVHKSHYEYGTVTHELP